MKNNFYSKHELTLKGRIQSVYLSHLIHLYGMPVRLRKSSIDVFSKVYGVESGEVSEDYEDIEAVLTADSFDSSDKIGTGIFDEGWMVTPQACKVNTGDLIEVLRDDGTYYQYKVVSKHTIGVTEEVMTKFRLASYHQNDK